jgi:hypothetical protein
MVSKDGSAAGRHPLTSCSNLGERSMILQAAPYLQQRFGTNATILRYFQASYLVFFAITMSLTTIVLNARQVQQQHVYTSRLMGALCAYVAVAALLMLSTIGRFHLRAEIYYPFTLAMVVVTGVANALSQNAAFAFVAGFGRTEYAPAIMTGEALAGLLPSTIGTDHLEKLHQLLIWSRNCVGTSLSLCALCHGCDGKPSDISLDTRVLSLCHACWRGITGSSGLSNTPQAQWTSLQRIYGGFRLGKVIIKTSMAGIGKLLLPLHLLGVYGVRYKDNVCCASGYCTNHLATTNLHSAGNCPLEYRRPTRVGPGRLISIPHPASLRDFHTLTRPGRIHPTLFNLQYRWERLLCRRLVLPCHRPAHVRRDSWLALGCKHDGSTRMD